MFWTADILLVPVDNIHHISNAHQNMTCGARKNPDRIEGVFSKRIIGNKRVILREIGSCPYFVVLK